MDSITIRSALACAVLAAALAALAAAPPVIAEAASGAGDRGRDFARAEVVFAPEGGRARVAKLPPGVPVRRAVAELDRNPGIEFAQPNWIARAALEPLDRGTSGEPGGWREDQWSLLGRPGGIRVEPAWDRAAAAGAAGGRGITVAVVDTGIAHAAGPGTPAPPDFAPGQFVRGVDIVDGDGAPLDENGHGTHIAATIGEQVTLGEPSPGPDYLAGIAYGSRLMPVRVLDRKGAGTAVDVGEGILWAARNGADVINVSLQFDAEVRGCKQVPTVCRATRKARRLGALVVAAAGNAPGRGKRSRALYPGAAPGVLAVAASTEHGCLAAYSHHRRHTDLLAPGGGRARDAAARPVCADDLRPVLGLTLACYPDGCANGADGFALRANRGSSIAAAHASGVAALVGASGVVGADPRPGRLARRLVCTARTGKPRRFYGDGMLDAQRATDPGRDCARGKRRGERNRR